VDAWHHEQDIRAALALPGGRDAATCRFMADYSIGWLAARWRRVHTAAPAVQLLASDQDASWTLGEGSPQATVRASCFELARTVLGRRSRDQLMALQWTGDPQAHLDRLYLFGPADNDLVE
jgi:hypothetical protein